MIWKICSVLCFKTNPKHLNLPMKTQDLDAKWNRAISESKRKHPVDILTHSMSQKEKVPFPYCFKYHMNSMFLLNFLCIFVSILQTASHSQCYFLMFIHCQLIVCLSFYGGLIFLKPLLEKALGLKMHARTELHYNFLQ